MTHTPQRALSPERAANLAENPYAGQGPVLLDIGGDIGAVVLHLPAHWEGAEVEYEREDGVPADHAHPHDHAHDHDHDALAFALARAALRPSSARRGRRPTRGRRRRLHRRRPRPRRRPLPADPARRLPARRRRRRRRGDRAALAVLS